MIDYTTYVRQREHFWKALEVLLQRLEKTSLASLTVHEVEHMVDLYHALLSDVGIMRRHFPGSEALLRVEWLLSRAHYHLYTPKKTSGKRWWHFFIHTYPSLIRRYLPWMEASALFFFFFLLWGAFLTAVNPDFALHFLPEDTYRELQEGRLWIQTVFQQISPEATGVLIAFNNISVAIVTWAMGALWGLGSLYIAAQNGLMVGTLLIATYHFNCIRDLLIFMVGHGVLEITLLIQALAAGFILAGGFIRKDGVLKRESFQLLLGSLPWYLLLGAVESGFSPSPSSWILHTLVGIGVFMGYLLYAFRR